ncbi:Transcriptional regulator NRG1 [Candida viswanathii]|uniref:Transcriptional regulator NRG1 n=1 Tax=Candida viswanathii TaxID=5486 RepID=A0A367YI00_9ASCO|nr:Transcriptional regulator NRG1 [Candida viswanathii]
MLYQQQVNPIQSSKLLPSARNTAASKQPTSLPSFNELLTSIPLPTDFKSASASTTPKSATIPSPSYSYYSSGASSSAIPAATAAAAAAASAAPIQHHRLPTPPLYSTTSSQQVSPHLQHSQPSYQYYHYQQPPQQQPVMVVGSAPVHVLPPPPPPPPAQAGAGPHAHMPQPQQIVRPSPGPITPTATTFDINPKIRSSSTGDLTATTHPHAMMPYTSTNSPTSSSTSPKDPRRKHVCKVCARSFTTSGHLARHNRIHTGERKHECPWPTCDARFARQDNCNQHTRHTPTARTRETETLLPLLVVT